jgi:hypothetical protein
MKVEIKSMNRLREKDLISAYCFFDLFCAFITSPLTLPEWSVVAAWKWDVKDEENCGICRMAYDGCCPDCKVPGDDCPLGMIVFTNS